MYMWREQLVAIQYVWYFITHAPLFSVGADHVVNRPRAIPFSSEFSWRNHPLCDDIIRIQTEWRHNDITIITA